MMKIIALIIKLKLLVRICQTRCLKVKNDLFGIERLYFNL
jgi:hypothetical protein